MYMYMYVCVCVCVPFQYSCLPGHGDHFRGMVQLPSFEQQQRVSNASKVLQSSHKLALVPPRKVNVHWRRHKVPSFLLLEVRVMGAFPQVGFPSNHFCSWRVHFTALPVATEHQQ